MRKYYEKFVEGILFTSSTITSLAVIFIIIFLFSEGIGLFTSSPVEKGSALYVNSNNPVKKLRSEQIKKIFNGEIMTWKEVGGTNDSIFLFSMDDISKYYTEADLGSEFENLPQKLNEMVVKHPNILMFFSEKYIPVNFKGTRLPIRNVTLTGFFGGKEWYPTTQPAAQFGILPLILGTIWVSLGAILIAFPLGIATAIYLAEVASPRLRFFLKPLIELLAGIPSVIFGFFGLIIVVPLIQKIFAIPVGETALAGSIILGIMALPTIITISEDAIKAVPRSMQEASMALGANQWQTIVRVVIPYAKSGITAATILGIGRAIGETMAVLMVTGNAAIMPHTMLQPVRTIPATIAAELGEASYGGLHFKALFALGIVLFLITLIVNTSVEFIRDKSK
ncbi:MAG: phosphate ABC transporter permease subunit PstC [Bacteroidia bacterium]|nr:phosphate ABC transporter permease subunit PstC [Bacteroidia bacterium]